MQSAGLEFEHESYERLSASHLCSLFEINASDNQTRRSAVSSEGFATEIAEYTRIKIDDRSGHYSIIFSRAYRCLVQTLADTHLRHPSISSLLGFLPFSFPPWGLAIANTAAR